MGSSPSGTSGAMCNDSQWDGETTGRAVGLVVSLRERGLKPVTSIWACVGGLREAIFRSGRLGLGVRCSVSKPSPRHHSQRSPLKTMHVSVLTNSACVHFVVLYVIVFTSLTNTALSWYLSFSGWYV